MSAHAPSGERLGKRAETVIGVLIVLVSISGAYVTWRAAEAAGAGSDFDQRGRQAALLRDQITNAYESTVSYEQRLFDSFQDHVVTATALEREAARLRRRDPIGADELLSESKRHRTVARALEMPFNASPVKADYTGDPRSEPFYDAKQELTRQLRSDSELVELRPHRLEDAADQARNKRMAFVAIDTGVIAAIFFLTLSLLAARMSRQLALVGVALVAASAVAFVVVEIVMEVPVV